jgi:hypothetical protein
MTTVENGRVTEGRVPTATRGSGTPRRPSWSWPGLIRGLLRGLVAAFLGTLGYDAIPSLGPFHGAPGELADLPHRMTQDTQSRNRTQRTHLQARPLAPGAFVQAAALLGEAS